MAEACTEDQQKILHLFGSHAVTKTDWKKVKIVCKLSVCVFSCTHLYFSLSNVAQRNKVDIM